ncbi:hypothetical protein [Sphingopyxis sp. JAI128]|uniref:hypothetical protein n=1 Tax=Sphingopyxis sp. JAI128 TaxID=2723066 RepID=UPI00160FBA26|nr:hypothetical protein [Sphingopyxis sp. JAI128]MBB6426946.1 hypothetical protein [Sphingopyxis sp. JAI128]
MHISNRPPYHSATISMSRRQAAGGPDAPPLGSRGASDRQFSTDLLNALMNSAGGGTNSTLRLANIGAGETPLTGYTVDTPDGPRTYARGGEPLHDAAYRRDAAALAFDLVSAIGSEGAVSLAEVEKAMGIEEATCDAKDLRAIRSVIENNWDRLSGGSRVMTAGQLSDAIAHHLG